MGGEVHYGLTSRYRSVSGLGLRPPSADESEVTCRLESFSRSPGNDVRRLMSQIAMISRMAKTAEATANNLLPRFIWNQLLNAPSLIQQSSMVISVSSGLG
jgi:hypothetical protein